jgi:hypothetical protein
LATSIKERHPLQGGGGGINFQIFPPVQIWCQFFTGNKSMLCVREREETAVDSAWVTDFGEGFGLGRRVA